MNSVDGGGNLTEQARHSLCSLSCPSICHLAILATTLKTFKVIGEDLLPTILVKFWTLPGISDMQLLMSTLAQPGSSGIHYSQPVFWEKTLFSLKFLEVVGTCLSVEVSTSTAPFQELRICQSLCFFSEIWFSGIQHDAQEEGPCHYCETSLIVHLSKVGV